MVFPFAESMGGVRFSAVLLLDVFGASLFKIFCAGTFFLSLKVVRVGAMVSNEYRVGLSKRPGASSLMALPVRMEESRQL